MKSSPIFGVEFFLLREGVAMSGRLTDEFVESVQAQSDLVSVVSGYVPLKRRGNRYWGCCPFHQEDTPSFSVKPDEGFFYCFGCKAGGNVFKFISMIEGVNYYEAIKLQAERLNIPVPEREKTPKEIAREAKRKDLMKVHEMATAFFHNCLTLTAYGQGALNYLHGRGITDEIIKEFKLGCAPDAWSKLTDAFIKREIPGKLLEESGLSVAKENSGRAYDRFRNRAMIPIADERGRVVAFGGRILGNGQPKYLNSPESPIFNKRRLLFGLDKAKRHVQQADFVLVTEGYMDAISVYAAGIRNAVASLGTAFTEEQCRLLMRYTSNIYFCYDSDNAGQTATVRAMTIAKAAGADVRVVMIPDGKDPDEFIRKHGADSFRKLIDDALPLMEYHIRHVMNHANMGSLEGRVKAMNELMPVLAGIKNSAELSAYSAKIAQLLGIDEGDIRAELRRSGRLIAKNAEPSSNAVKRRIVRSLDNAQIKAARVIIRLAWDNPEVLESLEAAVPLEFLDERHAEVISAMKAAMSDGRSFDELVGHLGEGAAEELSRSLVEDYGSDDLSELYDDCLKKLRKSYLASLFEEHRQRAIQLELAGDDGFLRELAESQRIKHEMDELYSE